MITFNIKIIDTKHKLVKEELYRLNNLNKLDVNLLSILIWFENW